MQGRHLYLLFFCWLSASLLSQTKSDTVMPIKVNYSTIFDSLYAPEKFSKVDSLRNIRNISKNVVFFGITKLLRGYANIYYERHLFNSFSFALGTGVNLSNDYVITILYPEIIVSDGNPGEQILSLLYHAQPNKGGLMIDLSFKYYPGLTKRNNGFYLGPTFARYAYGVTAKALPQGDYYIQDKAIRNREVTELLDLDERTLLRVSYFSQDQKFEIKNTHFGLVFGFKNHSKGAVKIHYDWSFSIVRNIITTNQIAIDNTIQSGQNFLIARQISQIYSIKRMWFGINLKVGFGK